MYDKLFQSLGDTRTEFSALLNSAGSVVILGGFTLVAYIRHKQIEFSQSRAFKREQLKAQEYKEVLKSAK